MNKILKCEWCVERTFRLRRIEDLVAAGLELDHPSVRDEAHLASYAGTMAGHPQMLDGTCPDEFS